MDPASGPSRTGLARVHGRLVERAGEMFVSMHRKQAGLPEDLLTSRSSGLLFRPPMRLLLERARPEPSPRAAYPQESRTLAGRDLHPPLQVPGRPFSALAVARQPGTRRAELAQTLGSDSEKPPGRRCSRDHVSEAERAGRR